MRTDTSSIYIYVYSPILISHYRSMRTDTTSIYIYMYIYMLEHAKPQYTHTHTHIMYII